MSKAVATKQTNAVSTELLQEWGTPQVMSKDILISKILPMQGLSVMVTEGTAVMGELRDSVSGDKLAGLGEPIELIPFFCQKTWDEYNAENKWVKTYPLIENPRAEGYNDLLPWKDTDADGQEIKRVRRMNFFVLRPEDIASGQSLPYIISFKSMSFIEGKKMFSQMYMKNLMAKLPPAAYTFKIATKKAKNDKGTFVVPAVTLGRQTTADELAKSLEWFKIVKAGNVITDDSDVQGTTEVEESADY